MAVAQAGEDVGCVNAAGVFAIELVKGVIGDALLDGGPSGGVDDRFAVVFDDEIGAKLEDADVDFVVEEGFVGVVGAEEVGGFLNLGEGGASRSHLEGALDGGDEFGIWQPTVGVARGAVAMGADLDKLPHKAGGWFARDAVVFFDEVAKAAFGIGGGLAAFFSVGDIYEEFDDAAVLALRDGVGDGVDDHAAIADESFVVDGVVEITREAGVVPEEDAFGTVLFAAGGVDEVVEFIT